MSFWLDCLKIHKKFWDVYLDKLNRKKNIACRRFQIASFEILGFRISFFRFLKNCVFLFWRFWKKIGIFKNTKPKSFPEVEINTREIRDSLEQFWKCSRKIELLATLPKNLHKFWDFDLDKLNRKIQHVPDQNFQNFLL